ncbi:MAG: RHS domain-containing protein, partial [Candidatus Thiodiazotropha sp.]
MGRRIRKQTQGEIIYFHYADEGLVGEFDGTGNPIRLYGYQPDSTWTTNPIYQKTAQGYAYYQNDHLGTPQQLIQKSGAKVWEGEMRAFGELTMETGTWGFTQNLRTHQKRPIMAVEVCHAETQKILR